MSKLKIPLTSLVLGLGLFTLSFTFQQNTSKSCLEIIYNYKGEDLFEGFSDEPYQGSATPVKNDDIQYCKRITKNFKSKYPSGFLCNNLHKIYFFESLNIYGAEYGGTWFDGTICTVFEGSSTDDMNYTESVLHSEFSSVLASKYESTLPYEKWKEQIPPNHGYHKFRPESLLTKDYSLDLDTSLFKIGYLASYSMTNFENDFNGIYSALFMHESTLWENIDNYPLICNKVLLTIEFLIGIDNRLNFEYFKSL